jgi:hypothetical protein
MNLLAYCTEVAASAVRKALGVEPLTSPPVTASSFPRRKLRDLDMLYFRLHGEESEPWRGEGVEGDKPVAFTPRCLSEADLGGCVVVVANCYGSDDPLVAALYEVGAEAVIAGPGLNYAAGDMVTGADLLARWLRFGLELDLSVQWALRIAKLRLRIDVRRFALPLGEMVNPSGDALAFDVIDKPLEV